MKACHHVVSMHFSQIFFKNFLSKKIFSYIFALSKVSINENGGLYIEIKELLTSHGSYICEL
jgi:hypothetical protein